MLEHPNLRKHTSHVSTKNPHIASLRSTAKSQPSPRSLHAQPSKMAEEPQPASIPPPPAATSSSGSDAAGAMSTLSTGAAAVEEQSPATAAAGRDAKNLDKALEKLSVAAPGGDAAATTSTSTTTLTSTTTTAAETKAKPVKVDAADVAFLVSVFFSGDIHTFEPK